VAVASAGPYASLHLAPDRQPHQHLTTPFFTGRVPFLPPNHQHQSTEGTQSNNYQRSEKSHMKLEIISSRYGDGADNTSQENSASSP